jgi:hypothetical protein
VQYSIVTSDFTRASFIFLTLCVRDDTVELRCHIKIIRSMSRQASADGEALRASCPRPSRAGEQRSGSEPAIIGALAQAFSKDNLST